jgi:hypothetical protein
MIPQGETDSFWEHADSRGTPLLNGNSRMISGLPELPFLRNGHCRRARLPVESALAAGARSGPIQ